MDTQRQCDLMGLISCACQTKRPRNAQRKQGGKREERIFDLVSTWKQAVGLLITPLYSTGEQSCAVQRGALYISSPRKAIYRRGFTLLARELFSFFFFFELFFRCPCSSVAAKKRMPSMQFPILRNYEIVTFECINIEAFSDMQSQPKIMHMHRSGKEKCA